MAPIPSRAEITQATWIMRSHFAAVSPWGVSNSRMLDGKVDGCSQWFLSRLVLEEQIARRVNRERKWGCGGIKATPF